MQVFVILSLVTGLIFLQLLVYRRYALSSVRAGISFSFSVAECGDTVIISEEIENKKKLPLVQLLLRFEAPRELHFPDMTNTALSDLYYREDLISLGGWKRHIRHITVRCKKRGYYEFKRLSVTTCDLLMLIKIYGSYSSDSTLSVLPRFLNTPDVSALFMSAIGERVHRYSAVSNPFTFSGIREYQPFDSFNKINWSATARKGEWMVNTSDCTVSPEITILLNVARYSPNGSTELIEKAISLAYSFTIYSVRDALPVSVISNSRDFLTDEPIYKPHGSNEEHAQQIGLAMSRIDLSKRPTSFDELLSGLPEDNSFRQLIVISPNFDTSTQTSIMRLIREGFRTIWIVPCGSHQPPPLVLPELTAFCVLWEERYGA
ncbi:MAG: DUF58 domain-containing protein [Clostridiales bacterium]|nr:DUF58 domain-containing protein [Clostridiales bacterium]